MIFKIITITLLTICAAENQVLPMHEGSRTIPALKLKRLHMPLSLTYTHKGTQYSTASAILRPGPVQNIYQRMQYAPLDERIGSKNKKVTVEFAKVNTNPSSTSVATVNPNLHTKSKLYAKEHLEPRIPTIQDIKDKIIKCYSSSHDNEDLSSVSRSPGHNAVYRNFLETVQTNKPLKLDYMKPFGVYSKLNIVATTLMPFELPQKNLLRPHGIANKQIVPNTPNAVKGDGSLIEKKKRQHSPLSKFHRLHLNIARVYSPGQLPTKPLAYSDTDSMNLKRLLGLSEDLTVPVNQARLDQKTGSFQTKDDQKKYRYRLPI